MDDETNELLREIRDIMRDASARDGAWIDEARSNLICQRRLIGFLTVLVLTLVLFGFCGIFFFGKPSLDDQRPLEQFKPLAPTPDALLESI